MDETVRRQDGAVAKWRAASVLAALLVAVGGCEDKPQEYGRESQIKLALARPQVWAVAPVINLSGQPGVDPLIQADLVYQQLQQVEGVTAIPVDRVATVYGALGIQRVQSPEQAAIVCDLLGADALLVPTVTAYEPYNPPKMGASLQLFAKPGNYVRPNDVDPRELVRMASPQPGTALPDSGQNGFYQSVGMFDASDGSVRDSLRRYSYGRYNPQSPYAAKEFFVSGDRYASFVYRRLTEKLLDQLFTRVPTEQVRGGSGAGGGDGAGAGAGGAAGGAGKNP